MSRMEKKQLKKEKNIKVSYILLAIFIMLVLGVSLVGRTLGHMTGNNDIRAIGVDFKDDIAIVHLLGNEYDVDYNHIANEINDKLVEVYEITVDSLINIKDKVLSINVGE